MNRARDALLGALIDGRYRIRTLIAHGGMSAVYLGVDIRLDRPVAVKVMDPKYAADPQFVARLEFEARAVAKLKDPGLVEVYDQGVDGDCAFLVMELVEGGTLRELLRERGPMPPHAVVAATSPVLGGLAAAHRHGLVHRDVKPENVLISDRGEIKVVDFGLVRAIADSGLTSASVILGTAAYLSPEQVASTSADARSDVYAAGILMFEMLTGRTPFTGDTPLALANQRLHRDVPAPGDLIPGVPDELDEVVLIATSRDPAHRYPDAGVMRAELDAVADRLGLPHFTVPAPSRSAEHRSAHNLRTGLAGAVPIAADDAPTTTRFGADPATVKVPAGGHPPAAVDPRSPRQHTRMETGTSRRSGPYPAPALAGGATAMYTGDAAEAIPSPSLTRAADDYPERRRRSRRRTAIVLVLVVVLAALLGLGGWWLGSGRFTRVPQITGMDRVAAERAITAAGLTVVDTPTFHDAAPAGEVIGADPAPGAQVTRAGRVRLQISAGRPTVPVITPGSPVTAVQAALRERTLRGSVAADGVPSAYPRGTVVSVSPTSGSSMPVDGSVTMTVSSGPAPVRVPDVTGRDRDDAVRLLEAAGLRVGAVRSTYSAAEDNGRAIRTDPAVGSRVESGSTVQLLSSNAITVPDVTGLDYSAARDRLQDAGLIAEDGGESSSGTAPAGTVTAASPSFGSRVDPDDPTVRLLISDSSTVPDVTGTTVTTARDKLERAGFAVSVQGLTRSGVSLVVAQSRREGQRVRTGSTITITAIP
ncbi:Stk1 family PASTA domain-containing Ser/Thr kinase [Williamsia sterculiae]|uniref:Stk1 family PASTA domain-containing Ser/Thr kinase n=1 Tax=Williamsia sterculiae TaxID=1344003 RepID=UPI0009F8AC8F|nr:Stk1 family PASTA domain-containing Ser/Thr kinase [Williamsia sterculiae]